MTRVASGDQAGCDGSKQVRRRLTRGSPGRATRPPLASRSQQRDRKETRRQAVAARGIPRERRGSGRTRSERHGPGSGTTAQTNRPGMPRPPLRAALRPWLHGLTRAVGHSDPRPAGAISTSSALTLPPCGRSQAGPKVPNSDATGPTGPYHHWPRRPVQGRPGGGGPPTRPHGTSGIVLGRLRRAPLATAPVARWRRDLPHHTGNWDPVRTLELRAW
jgi:hypothetical protein